MSRIIEADFFPPAVEEIKETTRALIVDKDAAHSVEASLSKASGSSTLEVSDTEPSSKRAEAQ